MHAAHQLRGPGPYGVPYPSEPVTPVTVAPPMPGLEALPTLDALAADTSLARSLDPSSLRALYARAARLEAELRAYLLTTDRQHRDSAAEAPPDHALTLREAAESLC